MINLYVCPLYSVTFGLLVNPSGVKMYVKLSTLSFKLILNVLATLLLCPATVHVSGPFGNQ